MCGIQSLHRPDAGHKHSIVQLWEIITAVPQLVVLHACMTLTGWVVMEVAAVTVPHMAWETNC